MDEQFVDDLDAVLAQAREDGITRIIIPAVDVATAHKAIQIAENNSGVYAAVGIHPESAKDVPAGDFDEIERLAGHPKVVAIGEIGLDYYWDSAPRPEQRDVMARQIEIAKRVGLPVIIHNRESTDDVLMVLRDAGAAEVGGVMHCFNESFEVAKAAMEMGFYISFGGPITFKKAEDVREVAALIPQDRLLVETDSPYLSPHPFRGKRNVPSRVRYVAEKLAEVQGIHYTELVELTTRNALKLFAKVGANE